MKLINSTRICPSSIMCKDQQSRSRFAFWPNSKLGEKERKNAELTSLFGLVFGISAPALAACKLQPKRA